MDYHENYGEWVSAFAGWGMRITFVPEEFLTDNPTAKVRKRKGRK